jgi:hypothetical protein
VPFAEPFIRQGFSSQGVSKASIATNDCNFLSLGILLLELCFGKRLEDHPLRRKYPATDNVDANRAFDLMAAKRWSHNIRDEDGPEFKAAVQWCFIEGDNASKDWRSEMIKHVIRPLELCQEHFKIGAA